MGEGRAALPASEPRAAAASWALWREAMGAGGRRGLPCPALRVRRPSGPRRSEAAVNGAGAVGVTRSLQRGRLLCREGSEASAAGLRPQITWGPDHWALFA